MQIQDKRSHGQLAHRAQVGRQRGQGKSWETAATLCITAVPGTGRSIINTSSVYTIWKIIWIIVFHTLPILITKLVCNDIILN